MRTLKERHSAIVKKARDIKGELIKIRRDIHSHPEIGLNEYRTSNLVEKKLEELGLEVEANVGKTGVVGLLRGKNEGKTVLLRADMDCLKLVESNDIEYKSLNPGFMHACGHDAHTAWLLGAAEILVGFKNEMHGNVKFVFQPAEESSFGAKRMINEGVLEDPHVDAAFGAHVWPYIESGTVGIKYGAIMAASDTFKLTIIGKGGHGAHPHKCIDPIVIACQVVMSLQNIISRKKDPLEPAVITVGKFNAGTAHNIIPDKVEIEGTIRTLSYEEREEMPKLIESMVEGIVKANGGSYKLEWIHCHPPVINDIKLTKLAEDAANFILGEDNITKMHRPTMAGEDFSTFQEKVPGVFFMIGTLDREKGLDKPLHNPKFNIDEGIIPKASAVLAECALRFLNQK